MHNENWIVFSATTDKCYLSRAFYFVEIPQDAPS